MRVSGPAQSRRPATSWARGPALARLPRRPARRRPLPAGDLLALAVLAGVLVALLVYVSLQPPTRLTFSAAAPPPGVELQNFYGPERNAAGPYRWSKPAAALLIPVAAPATYRMTLSLQDSPAVRQPRTIAVYANGAAVGTFALGGQRREQTVEARLTPATWDAGWARAAIVELQTAPFTPPGDSRALGALVGDVAVVPSGPPPGPWLAALLLPNVALLAVAYVALRALGVAAPWAAATLAALLVAYAALAVSGRTEALSLAYQASERPLGAAVTLLWVAATPLLARLPEAHWRWRPPLRHAPATHASAAPAAAARQPADIAPADQSATHAGALRPGLIAALTLFVTLRVALSLFALLASLWFPLRGPCAGAEPAPTLHAAGLDFRLLGVWQRWDGCWYEKIAALGYRPGDPSINFFPLLPALMRATGVVLADNLTLAGLIVSGVAYVAAMAGLYALVREDFGAAVARRTLLYLSVFPTAFFLFAPFSEALFLALAVWALLLARRGAWAWTAPLALLLGLTRAQGALLAAPLAWEAAQQWRAAAPAARRTCRRWALAALTPLLPVAGLVAFLAYGKVFVGRTALQTQEALWGNAFRAPWVVLAASWQYVRAHADAVEALNLAFVVAFAALLTVGLRRLPRLYVLYAAPQLLLVAVHENSGQPLLSALRYLLVLFPVFTLLALAGRRRRLHYAWLIVSLLLLAFLLYTFLSGPLVA